MSELREVMTQTYMDPGLDGEQVTEFLRILDNVKRDPALRAALLRELGADAARTDPVIENGITVGFETMWHLTTFVPAQQPEAPADLGSETGGKC